MRAVSAPALAEHAHGVGERREDVPPEQRDEGEYDSGAMTGDVAETSGGTVEGALGSVPEGDDDENAGGD